MKRFASLSVTLFMILCLVVASERRAFAYVDPGSGLIALQTVASVAAAYAYIVRNRIRALFTRKGKPSLASVKNDSREAA